MVEIIPVEDKLKQQAYCLQFGVDFDLALMAYVAFKDEEVVAICQFMISDGVCKIFDLNFLDNIRQTPIPFLLLRATAHFADGCGAHQLELLTNNAVDEIAKSAGFARKRQGVYEADLRQLCQ